MGAALTKMLDISLANLSHRVCKWQKHAGMTCTAHRLLLEDHIAQGDKEQKLLDSAALSSPQVGGQKARVVDYLSYVLKRDWGLGSPALGVQLFDLLR